LFKHSSNILQTPIEYLKGVGPQRGELLRKHLSIFTFGDLLQFYPYRYVDRSSIQQIRQIQQDGQFVQLIGRIVFFDIVGQGRARRLTATFKDASGQIELVWFQGISWAEKLVAEGGNFLVFGKVSLFNGSWNISHPELEKLEKEKNETNLGLMPMYSSNEKLKTRGITPKLMSKMIQGLLTQVKATDLPDFLPESICSKYRLCDRFTATQNIHFPSHQDAMQQALYRLKFEELFMHQIGICKLKLNHQKSRGFYFEKVGDYFNQFYKNHLPFELTDDQKNVIREIRLDTQSGHQMNRLLQGDVGSGKTIVALLCMLLAIDNGFQACLMTPTEILAQQHLIGIQELLQEMPIRVGFLSGSVKGKDRKTILQQLEVGEIQILIGTHALIESTVVFKNIGLSIIDEQHRFGVAQRAQLWKKNVLPPHVLVMTATPIPRTLAMTSYGDLEISVIKQLPPGRKPISTIHRTEMHRARVMDFIKTEIQQGRQAYIVYPLIEESEKLDYENLINGYEQVKQFFPDHTYNIAIVHGKQPIEEREQNMQAFVKGKAHIMVATTVIEVGVNVPNASVMLIESAERFGLSQLHQLRGRVGRGADKSYCILLTTPKLSVTGRERMRTMVEETSGFAIAEKDLELRGPGDIEGTRQSGAADLKLADIIKDLPIMEQSRQAAIDILLMDPELTKPEHALLKHQLLQRPDQEIWRHIS
jgi:ATP-dependent DNA helicase RecG